MPLKFSAIFDDHPIIKYSISLLLLTIPALLLSTLSRCWGGIFLPNTLFIIFFLTLSSFIFVVILNLLPQWNPKLKPSIILFFLSFLLFLGAAIYFLTSKNLAAWGLLWLSLVTYILIHLSIGFRNKILHGIIDISIALFISGILVAIVDVETRFSEEEFYSLAKIFILTLFYLSNGILIKLIIRWWNIPLALSRTIHRLITNPAVPMLFIVVIGLGSGWVVGQYQQSFYPTAAPDFPGITEQEPFLCTTVSPSQQTYKSEDVYLSLIEAVDRNPNKRAPEIAFLAIAKKDINYAEKFRDELLKEANKASFTQPANSVKYDQYYASFRVYYYHAIQEVFPELFSYQDNQTILKWFHNINRRATTIEWVDWLYAFAFRKMPEGPYENQEHGAGLLSLLEAYGYADPELSKLNQQYLNSRQFGWNFRFRNNDDVLGYQIEWLTNAYFYSLYNPRVNNLNQRLSFRWLLLQALPDGGLINYNSPSPTSLASIAYQGAILLGDPELLWLAGRSLEYLERSGKYLNALPGAERRLDSMIGISPKAGSCLIYAESGLPNQKSTLAPDKLIIREGWEPDSTYLLINLRFTGWHRYKATNTISLLYRKEPLMSEQIPYEVNSYLPKGRSILRDKRIPRENLNGLVVEREGLDKIIQSITQLGSPWAQDPPYYANIIKFSNNHNSIYVKISTPSWHRWSQESEIYLFPWKTLIIKDSIENQNGNYAMMAYRLQERNTKDYFGIYKVDYSNMNMQNNKKSSEILIDSDTDFQVIMIILSIDNSPIRGFYLTGNWINIETGQGSTTIQR